MLICWIVTIVVSYDVKTYVGLLYIKYKSSKVNKITVTLLFLVAVKHAILKSLGKSNYFQGLGNGVNSFDYVKLLHGFRCVATEYMRMHASIYMYER